MSALFLTVTQIIIGGGVQEGGSELQGPGTLPWLPTKGLAAWSGPGPGAGGGILGDGPPAGKGVNAVQSGLWGWFWARARFLSPSPNASCPPPASLTQTKALRPPVSVTYPWMSLEGSGAGKCGLSIRKRLKSYQGQVSYSSQTEVDLISWESAAWGTGRKIPKPGRLTQITLIAKAVRVEANVSQDP